MCGVPKFQHRRGLTLVELLVTFAIVTILLSLLMPGLAVARDRACRLVCAVNQHHVGVGLALYADQHNNRLVPSWFSMRHKHAETMAATIGSYSGSLGTEEMPAPSADGQRWDGLGILAYAGSACLDSHEALYCPCHHGDHGLESEAFAYRFRPADDPNHRVYTNYQYIGSVDAAGNPRLFSDLSDRDVIIADGFRSQSDVNHKNGANMVRGDLSVRWWKDVREDLATLPNNGEATQLTDDFVWDLNSFEPWTPIWLELARGQ
ncbi:MAG: type II secretion system protein [Planctomycetota bacterium]|nr:type II secretion system protein [Planctomycetota bacterium]